MRTHHDAKLMARALRDELARRDHAITYSQSLEIVAAQFGLRDWNTLAAAIADHAPAPGPGPAAFAAPVPILRIFAEDKAREFYCGFLGMAVIFEHRFEPGLPLYMEVARDQLRLHLSEHYGDGTPASAVFLPVTGIEAFHRELIARDYPYSRPGIEDAPWGRTLTVGDPFGNQLRFCEYHPG